MKAQRAVMGNARVVVRSDGKVFWCSDWVEPSSTPIRIGEPVDSWTDLPRAWAGVAPWFPRSRRVTLVGGAL